VEQRVVSAVGVRRDQLYEELGLRLFCRGGIVDRGLCFDDLVAAGEGGGCSGMSVCCRLSHGAHEFARESIGPAPKCRPKKKCKCTGESHLKGTGDLTYKL
jgi:hypothetical protein